MSTRTRAPLSFRHPPTVSPPTVSPPPPRWNGTKPDQPGWFSSNKPEVRSSSGGCSLAAACQTRSSPASSSAPLGAHRLTPPPLKDTQRAPPHPPFTVRRLNTAWKHETTHHRACNTAHYWGSRVERAGGGGVGWGGGGLGTNISIFPPS